MQSYVKEQVNMHKQVGGVIFGGGGGGDSILLKSSFHFYR